MGGALGQESTCITADMSADIEAAENNTDEAIDEKAGQTPIVLQTYEQVKRSIRWQPPSTHGQRAKYRGLADPEVSISCV